MRLLTILFVLLLFSQPGNAAEDIGSVWGFYGDSQTAGRAPTESSCSSSPECIENILGGSATDIDGLSGRSLAGSHAAYDTSGSKASLTWVHFQESGNQDLDGQRTVSEWGATFESSITNIASDSSGAIISYETAFSFGREVESYRDWTDYNTQLYTSVAALSGSGITVFVADVDSAIKHLQSAYTPADVWYQAGDPNEYHYTALGNFQVAVVVLAALGYDLSSLSYSGVSDIDAGQRATAIAIASGTYISGASGAISDGGSITISGSGFGSNTLSFSQIIQHVENTSVGSIPSNTGGWEFDRPVNVGSEAVAANDHTHSGTKSLYHDPGPNSALRYDSGGSVGFSNTIYATWWARANWSTDGQWKMFRVNATGTVEDEAPESVMFNWTSVQGSQYKTRPGPELSSTGLDSWMSHVMTSAQNVWYRHEVIINTASGYGEYDGTYSMGRYSPGSSYSYATNTEKMSYNTPDTFYRWFVWQNYQGNGMTDLDVWTDDHFVQIGSQARVELCDASTWPSRTSCDIQIPTAWSDTEITATVNTGSFATDTTAYLYVIDANGIVNATGYEVTIGETSGGDTTPPTVTAFDIPATGSSLTISVNTFTASDDTAVAGYLLTETATTPSLGDAGWSGSAQTEYTFSSYGSKTLYAWARDAAGNISDSASDTTSISYTSSTEHENVINGFSGKL